MFLVGGGILLHGLPFAHGWPEALAARAGALLAPLVPTLLSLLTGMLCGALVLAVVSGIQALRQRGKT